MTELQARLDSIQEQILALYEKGSTDLNDHLQFYLLIRKEQALLFLARQKGVKVSMPLPSLAASKARARDAIEMSLLIQSLLQSPYGQEPWTLGEVSRERLLAPPAYAFKKNGGPVQVQFGDNPDNVEEYTAWDDLYYQDESNNWHKANGDISTEGLFYTDEEGHTVYYVDFQRESRKHGSTGKWSLLYDNNALAFVGSPGSRDSDSSESSTYTPGSRHSRSRSRSHSRSRSRSITRPRTRSRSRSPSRSLTRSRSRSPRRGESPSPSNLRRRRQSGDKSPQDTAASTPATSPLRSAASRGRRRSERSPGVDSGGRPQPVAPEQVGASRTSVQRRSGSRLATLLREARDPPGLCIRGPANSVKCYRYTLKSKHAATFSFISTTWHWTESKDPTRVGDARMLILFENSQKRETFLRTVSMPRTMSAFPVSFGGL
uniref:Regulatory protein E2 n=1 Tax=Plecotus austriacus papillomavirus 1 TaxID=3140011 RepID=A0AAU6S4X2_9PAPI